MEETCTSMCWVFFTWVPSQLLLLGSVSLVMGIFFPFFPPLPQQQLFPRDLVSSFGTNHQSQLPRQPACQPACQPPLEIETPRLRSFPGRGRRRRRRRRRRRKQLWHMFLILWAGGNGSEGNKLSHELSCTYVCVRWRSLCSNIEKTF